MNRETVNISNPDCSICLSSNDSNLLIKLIKKMTLTYEINKTELKDANWTIQIEMTSASLSPSNEEKFESHFIEHGEQARIFNEGKRLVIWKNNEFLLTRIDNMIIVKGHESTIVYELVRKAIRQICTFELERKNGLRLHASSFEYKDKGVALLGDKGAGKTTSLLSMIAYGGATYITNDVLEVRPESNYLRINGWPTVCLVGRGTLSAIPRYEWLLPKEENAHDSSKPKVAIALEDIENILGSALTPNSKLNLIGFPKVNLERVDSEIKSIDHHEGLQRLIDHIINEDKDHPDWLLLRAGTNNNSAKDTDQLFKDIDFFEVVIGKDLEEACRTIIKLIEERTMINEYSAEE